MAKRMRIEVVHAAPEQVFRRTLELPEGATVADAVEASGVGAVLAAADDMAQNVGIFGRRVPMEHPLRDGDRVEVYRPLSIDPMEARRRRAERSH